MRPFSLQTEEKIKYDTDSLKQLKSNMSDGGEKSRLNVTSDYRYVKGRADNYLL